MLFFVRVLELACLWAVWVMYMYWMIIPHLAVFNVMITLGELARLCNCGLVLHELRKLAQKNPEVPTARRFKSQPSGTPVA